MKIYIIDRSAEKLRPIRRYFENEASVTVVHSDFESFMKTNHVECIVSPANSFGMMDGGYDLAITNWFGDQLQKRVQKYLIENLYGEQPVGTSIYIDAGRDNQSLIHTPSMRTPQAIKDPLIVYQCMRSTLMCALQHGVKSILIPLFGGATGMLDKEVIAEMMWLAYLQINNPPREITWDYIEDVEIVL